MPASRQRLNRRIAHEDDTGTQRGPRSPQLLDIIDQCMRLDPLARPQSAFALQRMLSAPVAPVAPAP
jgi:hypothetical protein